MLKAAFLHDTDSNFLGGAELSNKAILEISEQHGVHSAYDNLSDFRKTKQLISASDFVIVNSTERCSYEFLLIDFLLECGKPYVKWEHDYNFCAKRQALCFVDRKVKNCCDSERFTMHRKLFAHAKLSVFASPKHYQLHQDIYGKAIQQYFILPSPVDAADIQPLPKKKNTVCFVGNLTQQKGGDKLLDFAQQNPHMQADVFGSNNTGRELPANVRLKGKQRNPEVLRALAESEYFFFKPQWFEPGGRVAAEAFLAGCKTISNANVGFHSFPFYPAYPDEAREAMRNAPHQFWEKVKVACCHPEPVEGWSGQTPCFDKRSMPPALSATPKKKHRWKNVLIYKSFGGLGDFLFTIPSINKIASVSEKISVCAPFALHALIKKQLPQYEIHPEDFINKANLAEYDKIIDLSNYPSYRTVESPHKIWFPAYRRLKQHAFKHYLDGVAALHPEIDSSFKHFPYFKSTVAPKEKYFTVHPGAGFEAKYWPAWKYGKLILALLELFGDLHCQLILGPNDPKLEEVFDKIPERVSIPKGNLETIGDVLAGALLHVGNDSGMTHLAGIFNTPTVTIHGPTGPGTWMSFAEHKEVIWGKQGVCNIACNYDVAISCAHRICLNSVTPQRVLKHVLKLLHSMLPETADYKYIFNPEVAVEKFPDSFILKLNDKELLVEFSEETEKKLFEDLLENKLQRVDFSASFEQLKTILLENELLFKIPVLPNDLPMRGKKKQPVDVTLVSHVLKRDSIGRHGVLFAEMLDGAFSINGIPTRNPNPDDIEPALYRKLTHNGAPCKLALFTDVLSHNNGFNPYRRMPEDAEIRVCYSMFESSAIPAEWAGIINKNFDGVWVPDKWLVDVYKNSGVKKPVNVLPLACDLENFLKQPLKQKANEVFSFGVSSGIWMRKNIVGVVEAFQRAFPSQHEKVQLRIHSRYGFPPEVRKIQQAINSDSRIDVFIQPLSDKDYVSFMSSLDAYVLLSMGEGFSVTPREAMALGLPVILSDNTAHRAICESGLVYAVPTMMEIRGYYEAFGKTHGSFFAPDAAIAAQQMREIFENRNELYNDAQQRRAWAEQYDTANLKATYIAAVKKILANGIH